MSCTESVFDSFNCAEEFCGGCLTFCKCISNCDSCASTRCYCGQRYFLSLAVLFTLMMLVSCICFVCKKYSNSCTISTLIVLLNLVIASGLCMFLEPFDIKYEVIWGTTFLTLACTLGVCISYFCYPNFADTTDEFDFSIQDPPKLTLETPPKKKEPRRSVLVKIMPRRLISPRRHRTPTIGDPVSPDSAGSKEDKGISPSDSEETTSFGDDDVYGVPDEHPAFFSQMSSDRDSGLLLSRDSLGRKSINFGVWKKAEGEGGDIVLPPLSDGSTCEIAPL